MPILNVCYKRARVRISFVKLLLVSLAISSTAHGQKVEQALKAEEYTAIREIGVSGGFALVMAIRREFDQSVPEGDQWPVYSVSTKSGQVDTLLIGSSLQIKG